MISLELFLTWYTKGSGAVTASHLITRRASWFEKLSVVSPAEDLAILVEIDQIHQQLLTRGAHEACWVPAGARPSSGGENCHLPSIDASATLTIKRQTTDDP